MTSPTVFLDERYMLRPEYETRNYDLATDGRTMDFGKDKILIAGTAMTATAAELNKMDGVTATTAELNMLDDTVDDVTIAYVASGTTDGIVVTLTVKDAAGATIAAIHRLEVFVTDDDVGAVLTSTAASGALTATTGVIFIAHTAKKHITMTTAATGIGVLLLVDSANTAGERFVVFNPVNGKVIVGAETVAGDYEGG